MNSASRVASYAPWQLVLLTILPAVVPSASAQSTLFTLGGTYPVGTSSSDPSSMPTTMVVADFNGDGKADIATANNNGHGISVLLGDGAGKFTLSPGSPADPILPGTAVQAIGVGDFNSDGHPDLVAGNTFKTVVLLGDGAGGFTKGTGVVPSNDFIGSKLLSVGDFNGDGKPDLITYFNGSSFLLPGDGTGAFGPPQPSPLGNDPAIATLVAGDFNGDGKTDLATIPVPGTTEAFRVVNGDGTGRFQFVFNFQPAAGLNPLAAASASADYNDDGKPDILTFANRATQVWSWTGNTSSILTAFSPINTSESLPGYPPMWLRETLTAMATPTGPEFTLTLESSLFLSAMAPDTSAPRPVVLISLAAHLWLCLHTTSTVMEGLILQSTRAPRSSS